MCKINIITLFIEYTFIIKLFRDIDSWYYFLYNYLNLKEFNSKKRNVHFVWDGMSTFYMNGCHANKIGNIKWYHNFQLPNRELE
jgi:hypothetical protein